MVALRRALAPHLLCTKGPVALHAWTFACWRLCRSFARFCESRLATGVQKKGSPNPNLRRPHNLRQGSRELFKSPGDRPSRVEVARVLPGQPLLRAFRNTKCGGLRRRRSSTPRSQSWACAANARRRRHILQLLRHPPLLQAHCGIDHNHHRTRAVRARIAQELIYETHVVVPSASISTTSQHQERVHSSSYHLRRVRALGRHPRARRGADRPFEKRARARAVLLSQVGGRDGHDGRPHRRALARRRHKLRS